MGVFNKKRNMILESVSNIKSNYKKIPDKTYKYKGYPGIPVYHHSTSLKLDKVVKHKNDRLISKIRKQDQLGYYYIDDSTVNNLIVGGTRSGKGESYVLPMLNIASRSENKDTLTIIHDPKNELYQKTADLFRENEYNVYCLNILNIHNSDRWSIFELIISSLINDLEDYGESTLENYIKTQTNRLANFESYIDEFCHIIIPDNNVDDPFWEMSARNLLNILTKAFFVLNVFNIEEENGDFIVKYNYNHIKISDYINFVNNAINSGNLGVTMGSDSKPPFKLLKKIKDINDSEFKINNKDYKMYIKHSVWYRIINTIEEEWNGLGITTTTSESRTYDSMKMVAQSYLKSVLNDHRIQLLLSEPTITFDKLINSDKPSVVYIVSSPISPTFNSIISLFISSLYNYIFQSRVVGKTTPRTSFIIDEFPRLPSIPNMEDKIAQGLGYGLLFTLIIQNIAQLKNQYGDNAKTIYDNCSNKILIKPSVDTLDELISDKYEYDLSKYVYRKTKHEVYILRLLEPQSNNNNRANAPVIKTTLPYYHYFNENLNSKKISNDISLLNNYGETKVFSLKNAIKLINMLNNQYANRKSNQFTFDFLNQNHDLPKDLSKALSRPFFSESKSKKIVCLDKKYALKKDNSNNYYDGILRNINIENINQIINNELKKENNSNSTILYTNGFDNSGFLFRHNDVWCFKSEIKIDKDDYDVTDDVTGYNNSSFLDKPLSLFNNDKDLFNYHLRRINDDINEYDLNSYDGYILENGHLIANRFIDIQSYPKLKVPITRYLNTGSDFRGKFNNSNKCGMVYWENQIYKDIKNAHIEFGIPFENTYYMNIISKPIYINDSVIPKYIMLIWYILEEGSSFNHIIKNHYVILENKFQNYSFL